jgi:hypothetical protein
MKGTLLLTILNIQSSCARDLEETVVDASCVPDTLQWWIGSEEAWRIRTYALDHDIHTYSIGRTRVASGARNETEEYRPARGSSRGRLVVFHET